MESMDMKGVILAGGTGSRLMPLTKSINKHLLPVGGKPMIYWPISTLKELGIKNILIVTGGNHLGSFMEQLGDGEEFGVDLTYKIQSKPNGIAGGLKLAEQFVGKSLFATILGDNIFKNNIKELKEKSLEDVYCQRNSLVVLRQIQNPNRFGVAVLEKDKITKIVEKPKEFISPYAVTGLYFYPPNIFNIIEKLKPSKRGELEITDVNNRYIKENKLKYHVYDGFWSDAGTHASIQKCNREL